MFFSSSQHNSAVSAPLEFMLCSPTPHPQVPWAGTMSIIDVPSVVGMKWASFSVHGGNWALQLAARGPVTQLELLAKRRCSRLDQEHCRIILETIVPHNFFFFFCLRLLYLYPFILTLPHPSLMLFSKVEVKVLVAQLCLTVCNPMDCSQSGCSVHGTLQARIQECVAIPFSRGIFPTQGLNPSLLYCRQILYCLTY